MIKTIYSIRDQKTQEFLSPYIEHNDGTAQREFYNTLSQVPTMSQHPQDFDLYSIGDFNTTDGAILAQSPVQLITNGLACVKHIQKAKANGTKEQKTKVSDDTPIQPST